MPAELTPFLDTMPKYIIHRHEKSHETANLANLIKTMHPEAVDKLDSICYRDCPEIKNA